MSENNLFYEGATSKSRRIIYTPSSFARSSLLHLQECGELTALKPHISSRKNLNSCLFFIVLSGSGMVLYDGTRYELAAGDAVFIDCRRGYEQSSSDDLWSLKWCHFYGSNATSIYRKFKERGGGNVFRPKDFTAYADLLDTIYTTAASESYIRDMLINRSLTDLLTMLMEETVFERYSGHAAVRETARLNAAEVRSYIDANFREPLTLENIAAHFYVNKSYLARIFKEQFGMSVGSYICRVRVGRAKELLRFTDCTVQGIAAQCGYEDSNYFSRQFKKIEGISPSEFRQSWLGGR